MKLTELKPKRIDPCMFVFLCPHCRETYLSCATAPMTMKRQRQVFEQEFGDDWNLKVVPVNENFAWTVTGGFMNSESSKDYIDPDELFMSISVTPSIDASTSGHWHGHITNGEIK